MPLGTAQPPDFNSFSPPHRASVSPSVKAGTLHACVRVFIEVAYVDTGLGTANPFVHRQAPRMASCLSFHDRTTYPS